MQSCSAKQGNSKSYRDPTFKHLGHSVKDRSEILKWGISLTKEFSNSVISVHFNTHCWLLINNFWWQVSNLNKSMALSKKAPVVFIVFKIMKESGADG